MEREGQHHRSSAAEAWVEVFRWELETGRPRLVVPMGKQVMKLVEHLGDSGRLELPRVMYIDHYSYIAFRPKSRLGPMHPDRVEAYRNRFADIRAGFNAFSGP